jgi:hypothetical protein
LPEIKLAADEKNISSLPKASPAKPNPKSEPKKQVIYLAAFIKICENNFNLESKNDIEKVRFLAAAYNYGFWKTAGQIENIIDKKFYGTTIIKTESYSYSDVSVFWYKQYLGPGSPVLGPRSSVLGF